MVATIRRAATYVPKGGVGKTTSAAHIAVAAHRNHGLDVILVDLAGTQNDLATQFGLDVTDDTIDAPISAVFGEHWDTIVSTGSEVLSRMIFETGEGPDLIPGDTGLAGENNNLASVPLESRFTRLERFISEMLASEYDLVVFDLPGAENNIALNGLNSAGHVLAPLKPGEFELEQLENLEADFERIRQQVSHDAAPVLEMVIPTMVEGHTTLSDEFVVELTELYEERVTEPVAKTQDIPNQQRAGETLYAIPEEELYDTGQRARKAYDTITTDLLDTINPR